MVDRNYDTDVRRNLEQVRVSFDPVQLWDIMRDSITVSRGKDFDEWIHQRKKILKELEEQYPWMNYKEIASRISGADRGDWGRGEIQRINRMVHPGFEIDEVLDRNSTAELIAQMSTSRDRLWPSVHGRNRKPRRGSFVPTDSVDALGMATMLPAIALKEGLRLGKNAVDLGGGDGGMAIPFAMAGFNMTSIEQVPVLHEAAIDNERILRERGARIPGRLTYILGEFHETPSENTAEIRSALQEADLMTCYEWSGEPVSRLRTFYNHAKPSAFMILYKSGIDDWHYRESTFTENRLRRVPISDNHIRDLYGGLTPGNYPLPGFASQFCLLQKA